MSKTIIEMVAELECLVCETEELLLFGHFLEKSQKSAYKIGYRFPYYDGNYVSLPYKELIQFVVHIRQQKSQASAKILRDLTRAEDSLNKKGWTQ